MCACASTRVCVYVHAYVCVDSNHIYVLPSLCVGGFFLFFFFGQWTICVCDGWRQEEMT